MKNLKKTLLAVLALTVATAACADGPMAPEADLPLAAAFAKGAKGGNGGNGGNGGTDGDSSSQDYTVLEWITPITQDITVSALCQPYEACNLEIPELQSYLTVPSESLTEPTVITMTAVAGNEVSFLFGPHGTQFLKEVNVSVHTSLTTTKDRTRGEFFAIYWVDNLEDVQELIPASLKKGVFYFHPTHFSGYALAM